VFVAHKGGVEWGNTYEDTKICADRIKHPWLTDRVQFARLLCEMSALGLPDGEDNWDLFNDLKENMDLTDNDIDELFERAHKVWEDAKERMT